MARKRIDRPELDKVILSAPRDEPFPLNATARKMSLSYSVVRDRYLWLKSQGLPVPPLGPNRQGSKRKGPTNPNWREIAGDPKHVRFALWVAHRASLDRGWLKDEAESMALVMLVSAAKAYPVDSPYKFTTFAFRRLYGHIRQKLRRWPMGADIDGPEPGRDSAMRWAPDHRLPSAEWVAEMGCLEDRSEADLRTHRLRRGIGSTELANQLGVAQPRISEWEAGRRQPNWDRLVQMASAIGVRVGEIDSRIRVVKEILEETD